MCVCVCVCLMTINHNSGLLFLYLDGTSFPALCSDMQTICMTINHANYLYDYLYDYQTICMTKARLITWLFFLKARLIGSCFQLTVFVFIEFLEFSSFL